MAPSPAPHAAQGRYDLGSSRLAHHYPPPVRVARPACSEPEWRTRLAARVIGQGFSHLWTTARHPVGDPPAQTRAAAFPGCSNACAPPPQPHTTAAPTPDAPSPHDQATGIGEDRPSLASI